MHWNTVIVFAAISFVVVSPGALDHDWSLEKMCLFHKGLFEPRPASDTGDVCKFEFPTSTSSQDEAELFCNTFVPYHNIEVQHGKKTKCKAMATLMCEPDWVQMYGRCYQITRKLRTYKDTQKHCGGLTNSKKTPLGASVAFLHREDLIGRWRDYFQNVNRFWLDASVVYTEKLYYNRGPNMLLALDGHRYRVKSNSLLRVPETEKAFSLCEYTPPMNKAESNYLIKQYEEIYYPSIKSREGVSVRSASSRNRKGIDRLADTKYCQGVLSPFVRAVDAQPSIPTAAFIKALTEKKSVTLIRSSVYSLDSNKNNRVNANCTISASKNYGFDVIADDKSTMFRKVPPVWRASFPKDQCDGGSWSTGILLGRKDAGLEDMSDARSAPLYCQTRFESQSYGNCPAGYTAYKRKNGQKWCHRFFTNRAPNGEAKEQCAKEGGFLTGFTDFDELKLIDKLAGDAGVTFSLEESIWLGAERRRSCDNYNGVNGFDPDPNSPCSRKRVFEWLNGVAPNPPEFEDHWVGPEQPYFWKRNGEYEWCLSLLKGYVKHWPKVPNADTKLNDVGCDDREHLYVVCGQEAEILLKTLE